MSRHGSRNAAHRKFDHLLRTAAPDAWYRYHPYWRLVNMVRNRSDILKPSPALVQGDGWSPCRPVQAMARLARCRKHWIRNPEEWSAPEGNPHVQFRSLVQHLLNEYPVPNFMVNVWLDFDDNDQMLDLYRHLAQGRSIRQFGFPGWSQRDLPRSVCAFFMQAPDDLSPVTAMRWATVRAAGGCQRLARLIACQSDFVAGNDEEFWASVFRFLVKFQPISREETLEIIKFLDGQKFQPGSIIFGRPAGNEALQPDFSMRGRTLMSLRRHMANWRDELIARCPELLCDPQTAYWKQSSIRPFALKENDAIWTINELLSGRELHIEGVAMKHCVAEYTSFCTDGVSSIWSMRCQTELGKKRIMTIEVDPDGKQIIEARGRRNIDPDRQSMGILRRWAEREGLTIDACL